MADFIKSLKNLSFPLSRAETFAKIRQFCWCDLKFDLPRLSRADIFAKIRQFSWSDFKNEIASINYELNFRKNILDLMKSLENLHCFYYPQVKFSQKIRKFWCHSNNWTDPIIKRWNFHKNILDLMKSLENLNCRYYQEINFLQK